MRGKRKGATIPAVLAIAMTPPVAMAVEVEPTTVAVRKARKGMTAAFVLQ